MKSYVLVHTALININMHKLVSWADFSYICCILKYTTKNNTIVVANNARDTMLQSALLKFTIPAAHAFTSSLRYLFVYSLLFNYTNEAKCKQQHQQTFSNKQNKFQFTHVTNPCSIIPPNKQAVVWSSLSGYWGKNRYSSNKFRSMHRNIS